SHGAHADDAHASTPSHVQNRAPGSFFAADSCLPGPRQLPPAARTFFGTRAQRARRRVRRSSALIQIAADGTIFITKLWVGRPGAASPRRPTNSQVWHGFRS